MTAIHARGLTDPGLARQHNEDCFAIDSERGLFVVADGMGGHSHGEVASQLSVESIVGFVSSAGRSGDLPESQGDLLPHSKILEGAILSAQKQVLCAIDENLSLRGMGTTVVGLLLHDDVATVAHVGDSRIYLKRNGELTLLTRDHTWVGEQVQAGFLSEEEARTHPLRNVVTRALGGEAEIEIEVREIEIEELDVFLLCSDGLTATLRDEEIAALLGDDANLQDACQTLVDAANDRGGPDNVTVVLVSVDGDVPA